MTEIILIMPDRLSSYIKKLLKAVGLTGTDAATIAEHLVFANLRGIDSHGVSRLPVYVHRFERGLVEKETVLIIERETPVSMLIDGGNAPGIVIAKRAVAKGIEKAERSGLAAVGVKNSNHCGSLAYYTIMAAKRNFIAFAATNAPPMMAPWGGKQPYFGTNPLSVAVPTGIGEPLVVDMATSTVARGKILMMAQNSQEIPLGWAIDREGNPTTDPLEALAGMLLPVGGAKGYGLAFIVEILSSVLTGAAIGPQVHSLYEASSAPQNTGNWFLLMRADLFIPLEEFYRRMAQIISEVKDIPKAQGVTEIYLPGEPELKREAERRQKGIPLSNNLVEELENLGANYGVVTKLRI